MEGPERYFAPYVEDKEKCLEIFVVEHKELPPVYVYFLDNIDTVDEGFINKNIDLLPKERREKCLRYKNVKDRIACIAAFLLLKEGLKAHFEVDEPFSFTYSKHGKPYLRDVEDVHFNISHTRNSVVVVLAGFEAGVDIEGKRNFNQNLVERVCGEGELKRISTAEDRKTAFIELWSMKESYAKAYGISVTELLKKDIPQENFFTLTKGEYFISIYYGRYYEKAGK